MGRKPGFVRSSRGHNKQQTAQTGPNINFSRYQDYYDYGTKKETDGERFAVSDIKKAMNCYYDALTCYQKGIQVFQQNSNMLQGDLTNYQNIWYNYLRLLFYLLAEYKFVSGSVDILKYLPDNYVKKEMKDLVFEKENIIIDLYKSYNDCKNIIPLSEDTWDFYFNHMEFLNSFIEWYNNNNNNNDIINIDLLLEALKDQQITFNQLISLQMNVLMQYINNNNHINNNNSTDPVLQANMSLQKDIKFKINNENDTYAETMSNLTLSTFLEIYLIVFKSIRNVLENIYQSGNKTDLDNNINILNDLKSLHNNYVSQYSDFTNSMNSYDLKQELEPNLLTEIDYTLKLNNILFNITNPVEIEPIIKNELAQITEIQDNIDANVALLVIDQWDTILELLMPIDDVLKAIQTKTILDKTQTQLADLYSWESKWNLTMILNKLTNTVNKQLSNKIKTTIQKTKSFSSDCCNLSEILQSKSDLEIKRAYLKSIPDTEGNTNLNEYSILLKNSVAYLKNSIAYIQFDMGLNESMNDKLYRQYLLNDSQEKLKQLEQIPL